jgi:hypothetical protein
MVRFYYWKIKVKPNDGWGFYDSKNKKSEKLKVN